MRKKTWSIVYAVFCTLLLIGGGVACFVFAYLDGIIQTVEVLIGVALGVIVAPIVHELGHVIFAKYANMPVAYVKAFCFSWRRKGKGLVFRFASPFAPDETQVIPNGGEDIQKRAYKYAVGGLVFSGILWIMIISTGLMVMFFVHPNYVLWGASVYTGYLFLLNVLPMEYTSGKTDASVCLGLKKGCNAEKVMLSAMYIQGEAYAGKRYGEIDDKYYFNIPVLAEDEPLFALMLQLRYRYFVDKELWRNAGETLNRLAEINEYLTIEESQRVCAELVFMHSLNADLERAEECGRYCKDFLSGETAMAKRVLATFTDAFGEKEKAKILQENGLGLLENEWILGEKLWEEKLLFRLHL